jgi:hypothetical protein
MSLVLNSVYTKVRQNHNWGSLFKEELSQCVIDKLVNSGLEPRLLQKVLVSACGRAVLRTSANSESLQNKLEITVEDLNIYQITKQSKSSTAASKFLTESENKTEVVIMPIFNIPAISSEQNSEEIIILWSVYEIADGDEKFHHLVGFVPDRQIGRVTSAIRNFDRNSMRLITSTGRLYKLDGQPALKDEMLPVWAEWINKYNIENYIDVTHRYLSIH